MTLADRLQALLDWSVDDEEDPSLPDELHLIGMSGNRARLDAHFSRLTVIPDYDSPEDSLFFIRDCGGNTLGRWPVDKIGEVLQALLSLQRRCPGGATYVLLNNNSIIHQWQLNVKHYRAKMQGQRINDLPRMGEGKAARTDALLSELLGDQP